MGIPYNEIPVNAGQARDVERTRAALLCDPAAKLHVREANQGRQVPAVRHSRECAHELGADGGEGFGSFPCGVAAQLTNPSPGTGQESPGTLSQLRRHLADDRGVTLSAADVLRSAECRSFCSCFSRDLPVALPGATGLSGAVFRVRMCCQAVGRVADLFVLRVAA